MSNRNPDLIYNRLSGHDYDSVRQLSYLALDVPDGKHALQIVDKFAEIVDGYKIGLQLFHAGGSTVVETLLKKGKRIFLDMKLHDIPNTVAGALRAICDWPVEMVNIHALGGKKMMEAGRDAVDGAHYHPLLIAVTILTSMSEAELAAVGIGESPLLEVKRLAMLAENCGMDGVVASAKEIAAIRQIAKPGFEVVVPGTRLKGQAVHDQHRTLTPGEAVAQGATRLVIGRAVLQAENPLQALNKIWDDMLENRCE